MSFVPKVFLTVAYNLVNYTPLRKRERVLHMNNHIIETNNPEHSNTPNSIVLDTILDLGNYYQLPTTEELTLYYATGCMHSHKPDGLNSLTVLHQYLNSYQSTLELMASKFINFYPCNAPDAVNTAEQTTRVAYLTLLPNGLDMELRKHTAEINIAGKVKTHTTYALTILGAVPEAEFTYSSLECFSLPTLAVTRLMSVHECAVILNQLIAIRGSNGYLELLDITSF